MTAYRVSSGSQRSLSPNLKNSMRALMTRRANMYLLLTSMELRVFWNLCFNANAGEKSLGSQNGLNFLLIA
jgi:hypothetical protein